MTRAHRLVGRGKKKKKKREKLRGTEKVERKGKGEKSGKKKCDAADANKRFRWGDDQCYIRGARTSLKTSCVK